MKRLGAILLLAAIAISAAGSPGEAGWKKRGWYMKQRGIVCTMRKVTVTTPNGKVVVQKVRVCG